MQLPPLSRQNIGNTSLFNANGLNECQYSIKNISRSDNSILSELNGLSADISRNNSHDDLLSISSNSRHYQTSIRVECIGKRKNTAPVSFKAADMSEFQHSSQSRNELLCGISNNALDEDDELSAHLRHRKMTAPSKLFGTPIERRHKVRPLEDVESSFCDRCEKNGTEEHVIFNVHNLHDKGHKLSTKRASDVPFKALVKERKESSIICCCLYSNGDSFEGSFVNGKKNGFGVYTSASGHVYEGHWAGGKRHGLGTLSYANGDKLSGEWRLGKKWGNISIEYASGDRFEGMYEANEKNGPGCYTTSTGDVYQCCYRNGFKDGMGTVTFANGDVFEGLFKDDRLNGHGRMLYASGDEYIGEYANDKKHGKGMYTFITGDVYNGSWCNGQMHGHGTLQFANGECRSFEGEWEQGVRSRFGLFTKSNGEVFEGTRRL